MQETQEILVRSLGWEDPLEKEMVTHSSILTWKIPWTEEPGRLQSMGLQRVRHHWAHTYTFLSLTSCNSCRLVRLLCKSRYVWNEKKNNNKKQLSSEQGRLNAHMYCHSPLYSKGIATGKREALFWKLRSRWRSEGNSFMTLMLAMISWIWHQKLRQQKQK